jgi:hypothetical protein
VDSTDKTFAVYTNRAGGNRLSWEGIGIFNNKNSAKDDAKKTPALVQKIREENVGMGVDFFSKTGWILIYVLANQHRLGLTDCVG